MKDSPSQKQMTSPADPQPGKPNYVDDSAETPQSRFYPSRGQDAPAYIASDPRYWEYR